MTAMWFHIKIKLHPNQTIKVVNWQSGCLQTPRAMKKFEPQSQAMCIILIEKYKGGGEIGLRLNFKWSGNSSEARSSHWGTAVLRFDFLINLFKPFWFSRSVAIKL